MPLDGTRALPKGIMLRLEPSPSSCNAVSFEQPSLSTSSVSGILPQAHQDWLLSASVSLCCPQRPGNPAANLQGTKAGGWVGHAEEELGPGKQDPQGRCSLTWDLASSVFGRRECALY
jgi:hypothetical protein